MFYYHTFSSCYEKSTDSWLCSFGYNRPYIKQILPFTSTNEVEENLNDITETLQTYTNDPNMVALTVSTLMLLLLLSEILVMLTS